MRWVVDIDRTFNRKWPEAAGVVLAQGPPVSTTSEDGRLGKYEGVVFRDSNMEIARDINGDFP